MSSAASSYRLESLTRVFPGVLAVDRVNLEVSQSEIHGIIGKNGAGKSVLVSMIAGILRPSSGAIWIRDRRVLSEHYTPGRAHELGVSLIPQEPSITRALSVTETLYMGRPLTHGLGLLDHGEMQRRTLEIARKLSVQARPGQRMAALPIEDQQLLAFGKALFIERAQVILLDEITASLSRSRKNLLLEFLRDAIAQAPHLSFTLISHRISEILEFCDRVTVMRDGRAAATLNVAETTKEELAAWIVGEEGSYYTERARLAGAGDAARSQVSARRDGDTTEGPRGQAGYDAAVAAAGRKPVLRVQQLAVKGAFEGVDFDLAPGEVIGLAGLDGSGKDELLAALCGLMRVDAGTLTLEGQAITLVSPRGALAHGIAYLPRKRESQAVIHNRSVEENMLLSVYARLRTRLGLIDYTRGRATARDGIRVLDIKTPSLRTSIDHLSGGNRQKVIINRVMSTTPKVFVLNEPTRGVDLATKPEILKAIRQRLAAESGVILTSESEEELVEACDRILVLYQGKIRQSLRRGEPSFNVGEVYRAIQGVGLS